MAAARACVAVLVSSVGGSGDSGPQVDRALLGPCWPEHRRVSLLCANCTTCGRL